VEALLAAARARDRAPASLRARIERERAAARPVRRRGLFAVGLAGALAAAALALALVLPAGTPGAPSVSDAAALGFRPALEPAPAIERTPTGGTRLAAQVGPIFFPNYDGWRAVGMRRDRLGGRSAVTVYYQRGAVLVAYTIVGAPALAEPHAPVVKAGWLTVRRQHLSGREVVTWREAGDTCVLSSRQLDAVALARLAASDDVTRG
jgi:hypothetical protein